MRSLRKQEGGDIVVLASISVIRALLAADELDRLSVTFCPRCSAAASASSRTACRASGWRASPDVIISESGALCLYFDRVRA